MAIISGTGYAVYYRAESTEGVPVGSVQYSAISHHTEVEADYIAPPVIVTTSGGYDPTGSGVGPRRAEVTISGTVGPDVKTFIVTYGSSDTSVTIVVNKSSNVYVIKGCKVKRYSERASITPSASGLEYELVLWGFTITKTEPSSITYASITAGFSNYSDITVTIAGSGVTTWRSFEFTVENDLEVVPDNTGAVNTIQRGPRDANGTIVISSPVTVGDFTTLAAGTAQNIVISVTGMSHTFANTILEQVGESIKQRGVIVRTLRWQHGGTLTVA